MQYIFNVRLIYLNLPLPFTGKIMIEKKYHPDNVFLVSGYINTPDNYDAHFVIAANKEISISTVEKKNKSMVVVSTISLSEMRQVMHVLELTAIGGNPDTIVNEMFS